MFGALAHFAAGHYQEIMAQSSEAKSVGDASQNGINPVSEPTFGECVAATSKDLVDKWKHQKKGCGDSVRDAYRTCGVEYAQLKKGHFDSRQLDDDVFSQPGSEFVLVADYDPLNGDEDFEIDQVRPGCIAVYEGGPHGHVEIVQEIYPSNAKATAEGYAYNHKFSSADLPEAGWFKASSTFYGMTNPNNEKYRNQRVTVWRHERDIEDEAARIQQSECVKNTIPEQCYESRPPVQPLPTGLKSIPIDPKPAQLDINPH